MSKTRSQKSEVRSQNQSRDRKGAVLFCLILLQCGMCYGQESIAPTSQRLTLREATELALRIARIATGRLDVAFASGNSHDWDLAGADLLVHEAGGVLTTFAGEPVIYNRAEARHGALVAAGRARHDRVLGIIGDPRS